MLLEIVKSNAIFISYQQAKIFNLSFTQGVFPTFLKDSIVVPICKDGSHAKPSNYRPISILTIFSELLEKLYFTCLINFININNILHINQFVYEKNSSTFLAAG